MTKTAVLVSGGGANLQPLLDMYQFGEIPELELTAVISSVPDAYALERASMCRIPTYVVERALFPNNASFCNALLNKLRDVDTELVVCAGFTEKLNYPLLRFFRNRVIAAQPVLFPAFCTGELDPFTALRKTLELGVRIAGATAYFMSEEDNGYGPIIVQEAVEVLPGDTPAALSDRLMRKGEWVVLPRAVKLYCEGRLRVEGGAVIISEEEDGDGANQGA